MVIMPFGSWRRLSRLMTALLVLGAVSACGGGGGSSLPLIPITPADSTTDAPENEGGARAAVSEYEPWMADEIHASFIPSGLDEEGSHFPFPPGVRYRLYQGVDNFNDQAPVIAFGPTLHVGADVAPAAESLDAAGSRGEVAFSEGEVRDGIGASDVLAYLRTIAGGNLEGIVGLQKWTSPPYVRLVGTQTGGRYIRLTQDAARIVNAALPFTSRLRLQSVDTPITEERAASVYDYRSGSRDIFVRFVPKSDPWWSGAEGDELGRTRVLKPVHYSEQRQRREVGYGSGIVRADVLIDPDAAASLSDAEITHLMVHELLHAAGFMSHLDADRFRSTLNDVYVRGTEPRSLIHPIDREGLLAAYARFKAGTLPFLMTFESLGPWADTSYHMRGDLALPSGNVAFGVAFGNGLPQPWAFGPAPASALADNAALSGTASWKGALVGMTPAGDAVTGVSSLIVELSKVRHPAYSELDGTLRFTGIRFADGSGWGDGDLFYSIEVEGNGFHRARSSFVRYGSPSGRVEDRASGEDFGVVTGVFLGRDHEGMGGVLERHDLSAAFGGKR